MTVRKPPLGGASTDSRCKYSYTLYLRLIYIGTILYAQPHFIILCIQGEIEIYTYLGRLQPILQQRPIYRRGHNVTNYNECLCDERITLL